MYLTRCPSCGERTVTAADDVGRLAECSRCPAVYPAEVIESENTREAFVGYVQGKIRPTGERLAFVGIVGALIPVVALGLFVYQIVQVMRTPDTTIDLSAVLIPTAALLGMALLSGLVFLGAVQMQRVRYYPLCVLAAVLAMLPFANLCFPIGWIHGLMALYWLRKPEVRRAFALNHGDE